ncbi:MAG: hypothetical protein E7541_02610 [Ruminococcaceae bacterium]|nr:hypothetical protein [Oscillospiraceae bacterium]
MDNMEKEQNNSLRIWLTIVAILVGIGVILYTLYRMEKRLRRAYGRVEHWLNARNKPVTIDLEE